TLYRFADQVRAIISRNDNAHERTFIHPRHNRNCDTYFIISDKIRSSPLHPHDQTLSFTFAYCLLIPPQSLPGTITQVNGDALANMRLILPTTEEGSWRTA